jgi:hypothetical protein
VNIPQHLYDPAGLSSLQVKSGQAISKNYLPSVLPVTPEVLAGLGKRHDFRQPTSALGLGFAQIQSLRSGIARRQRTSAAPQRRQCEGRFVP